MITIQKPAPGITEGRLARFAEQARKAVGLRGKISLLLTSNREMRQLNRSFRGKDKATDVISFPAVKPVAAELAGDVAISVDIAAANARIFGHTTFEEICILILHGILHLAGYDHETDNGEMARKEKRLRTKLGLNSSLIARTEEALNNTAKKKAAKPRPPR